MNYEKIIVAGAIYLIVGFMVWLEIVSANDIEMRVRKRSKYMPFKLWKLSIFWFPRLFGIPTSKWMCK